jgi:hypothetical protein
MKQRVTILSSKKIDGRYNDGIVLGIEMVQYAYGIGYANKKEFYARFTVPRYKVVFIDCVTERAGQAWFNEDELERGLKKPLEGSSDGK